jgi:hypothetical protein
MYLGQEYYRRAKANIRIRIIIYRIHNIHTMSLIEKSFESLNASNWYNNVTKSGTAVAESFTGTDPNVELRIVNKQQSSIGSISYADFLINPELNSFDFNTEIFWGRELDNDGGDNYQIRFGSTFAFTLYFNFWDDFGVDPGYPLHFRGQGVYLLNTAGVPVFRSTTAPGPRGPGENTWYPVRVLYNKNAANTWTVLINGVTVLTYADPNVNTWQNTANNKGVTVSAVSGGGLKMALSVRRLSLSYKSMMPVLTLQTGSMPQKFYPSADDSTFSSNRAAYMRTLYPRITDTATAGEVTKQKLIYNRHDASSRMERLKLQAIGKSSMRLKETETLQFKAPNVNDVREALSRSRSQGYAVPPKCQNR